MILRSVDQAQAEFEILMAAAMNGEKVVIIDGETAVTLEPVEGAVIPGKVYSPADYIEATGSVRQFVPSDE